MGEQKEVLLEVKNLHKRYGPTIALDGVNLVVRRGEVHGLIGENGSGKSTLASIAAGMQPLDKGEMVYLGRDWKPMSMIDAQHEGFSMILQEENTINDVTVAENLFAGKEWQFTSMGLVSKKRMNQAADELLRKVGVNHINGKDNINRYGFEDKKLIEICRVITDNTQILIVDETTTALSHVGRELLYRLINKIANDGKAVIFISHDMDEIIDVCNVLTVLRDGSIIGTLQKDEMDPQKIRYMMVGREIGDAYYREDYDHSHLDEVVLEFKDVSFNRIKNFDLKLHKGEIIGIGGLSGSGMHEIGRAAFGLERIERGVVECNGKVLKGCKSAIENNMAYISKNRDHEALIGEGSIKDNITIPSLGDMSGRMMYISKKRSAQKAQEQIDAFQIKCNNGSQYVSTLSGGNKQKVSFAKWTAKDSDIFIMDCPTRGVDIGVKQFMYQLIAKMKKDGKAVILISEELAELIGMCDQIIIMKDHEISGQVTRHKGLQQTDIIEYII